MARVKIPGVYMVRIKPTNKIYIGQSGDIRHRFNHYRWGASSDRDYSETRREVCKEIRKYGIENAEFIILASGEKYADLNTRLLAEAEFIAKFDATNPDVGYNHSPGMEAGLLTPRKQSMQERARRANPVYLYDMKKDYVLVFFFGAKGVGQYLGFGKDEMSHSLNRGLVVKGRYYLFHVNEEKRDKVYKKLYKQRMENFDQPTGAQSRTNKTFSRYAAALQRTLEIMEDN